MNYDWWASLLLRAGVAFAFLYPPIDAIFSPYDWIGYFPPLLLQMTQALHIQDLFVLHAFGIFEVVIALWILWGRNIFIPSAIAGVTLVAIVAFDFENFVVVFRDLSIAAAAF